jgi:mersacidin/lichenicidin family type 2 lantibiotic
MKFDIVRAWKDARYRQSLTLEQLTLLPANPVGTSELHDADLEVIQGGSFGNYQMGSFVMGGDCMHSFGATGNDSCNTFAKNVVNCSDSQNYYEDYY